MPVSVFLLQRSQRNTFWTVAAGRSGGRSLLGRSQRLRVLVLDLQTGSRAGVGSWVVGFPSSVLPLSVSYV